MEDYTSLTIASNKFSELNKFYTYKFRITLIWRLFAFSEDP